MVPKNATGRMTRGFTTGALAIMAVCCVSASVHAAMTLPQLKALKGAAQLEMTLNRLFLKCGLPASIVDAAPTDGLRQRIDWNGTAMNLSASDWEVFYGVMPRNTGKSAGWVNSGKWASACASGVSQLQLHARGHVGVLTVTKKSQGLGYITMYREPKSLYEAHKVVVARSTLATSLPVALLISRYGQPDEVVKQPGSHDKYRYWVLTRRDHRPELLYAVDFEIDGGSTRSYAISSSSVDFVQQRLDSLLKQWERDYVLD